MKAISDIICRWPSQDAEQWVQAFIPRACSSPAVLAVVAFGSAVREADYSADVDLLIVYSGSKPKVSGRPVDVDIRWFERAEAERSLADGHELLGWVLRFGVLVCERDQFWAKLREAWLGRTPLPSAAAAEERAQRARHLFQELERMGDADAAQEQLLVALTQEARAHLIRHWVYPASRPELPKQLRQIGECQLSVELEGVLRQRQEAAAQQAVSGTPPLDGEPL